MTGTNPVSLAFTTTPATTADAMQARVHWTDTGRTFEWVAYAPADTASPLVLPTLPGTLSGSVPSGTADAWFVRIAESDLLDGYDDVRANYIQLLPTGTIVLNTPVTGSIVGIPLSQIPNVFHVTLSEGDKPVP